VQAFVVAGPIAAFDPEPTLVSQIVEAANKPQAREQVIAINDKVIATNPELAEDEAVTAQ
jgi:hypothetical protein